MKFHGVNMPLHFMKDISVFWIISVIFGGSVFPLVVSVIVVKGPGIEPANIVLPARYFYVYSNK